MRFIDDMNKIDLVNREVIGVDETGVGDYFTPLVACAAYVPTNLEKQVLNLGVKDSKKITDKKICEIAPKLMRLIPYSVYTLSQAGFNKLSARYNNNELKFFAHACALSNFKQNKSQFNPDLIVIDKYSTTNSILKYHSKFFENNWANIAEYDLQTLLVEKAEDLHVSVACASIIARYTLLQYMQKQNQEWNFHFSLGASAKVKEQVKEFVALHGEKSLPNVCKMNFKLSK
ncbi:ribonuclease HIII [Mycoplasma seminis]|uniref:Ribonuclease n=1 Tax=Mycoplasma seminis TaxID=512749 RepID=A0ABY9HB77_9MOLU|nr:ribonuclease HIII [Mycoplasma seminis]WLP85721.1 ribonuclease HIII [Mycoplasma seminis]